MGLLIIVLTFLLILIGLPIAVALGVIGVSFLLTLDPVPMEIFATNFYAGVKGYTFVAMPFFILAGELMNKVGITEKLCNFANLLVGRAPGGMAHTTVIACMFMGGITGSAVADASCIGGMMIPAMEKEGYPKTYSAALVSAASVMGPIIPPSIIMVVYCACVSCSIGAMFLGGMLPGILIALALMGMILVQSKTMKFPRRTERFSKKQVAKILIDAIWPLGMPVIILGGILSGIFTATEAGAIGVLYSLVVGFVILRSLTIRDMIQILKDTAITTGTIFFLVAFSKLISWVFAILQVQNMVANAFLSISSSPVVFLLLINILFLFLGCFVEATTSVLILAPVLAPIAVSFGIDPLHFGLITCINLMIGHATPPFGMALFVSSGIAKLPLEKLIKPLFPMLVIMIAVLFIITYVPQISLILPQLAGLA